MRDFCSKVSAYDITVERVNILWVLHLRTKFLKNLSLSQKPKLIAGFHNFTKQFDSKPTKSKQYSSTSQSSSKKKHFDKSAEIIFSVNPQIKINLNNKKKKTNKKPSNPPKRAANIQISCRRFSSYKTIIITQQHLYLSIHL